MLHYEMRFVNIWLELDLQYLLCIDFQLRLEVVALC